MANDIVIECSPYADTENEVFKLNTSYNIRSVGNLFTSSSDFDIFIAVLTSIFSLIALSTVAIGIYKLRAILNDQLSNTEFITNLFAFPAYVILFLVGIFALRTDLTAVDLTPWLVISLPIAWFVICVTSVMKFKVSENVDTKNAIFNAFFPGLNVVSMSQNITMFLILMAFNFLLYYLVNSDDNFDSLNGLLASYCFVHILNGIFIYSMAMIPDDNQIHNNL